MNQEEREQFEKKIRATLDKEKKEGFRNLNRLREVFLQIHQLEWRDRKYFEDFYNELNEELFKAGLKLKEYQPERFFREEKEKPVKKRDSTTDRSNKRKEVFSDLVRSIGDSFDLISRHCFFGIEREDNDNAFKVVLIHDGFSPPHTFVKIENNIGDVNCLVKDEKEFENEIKELAANNLICLFVFNARFNPEDSVRKFIKEIDGFCDDLFQLKIDDDQNLNGPFYTKVSDVEKLIEEICYQMEIDLHNQELSYKEIKILKKIFKDNQISSLQYKIINKGFSGAKVIKVIPIAVRRMPQNYVIKIRDKDDSNKLQIEQKAFRRFVEGRGEVYECIPFETERCYAIKYRYAETLQAKKSFSFGQVFNGNGDWSNQQRVNLIDKLFNDAIFVDWESLKRKTEIDYDGFYSTYINLSKILEQFSKIKALSEEEVENEPLIKNYKSLKSYAFNSYKKPCHGDLHSENIFVDDRDRVTLIDFGDTEIHHALIDHAALEVSIKLNHIPRYIENKELFEIEDELLNNNSFDENFIIQSSKREDLQSIFKYILKIRSLVKKFMDDPCEYYYSLFMITFRQIRYPGLNQLYAIYSAEKISEFLLENCLDN